MSKDRVNKWGRKPELSILDTLQS